jgi:hypothetical protein
MGLIGATEGSVTADAVFSIGFGGTVVIVGCDGGVFNLSTNFCIEPVCTVDCFVRGNKEAAVPLVVVWV